MALCPPVHTLNSSNVTRVGQVTLDTDLHIGQGRELDRGEQIVSNAFLEKDRRVRRVVGDRSIESWYVICTDCVRDGEGLPRRCDCGKGQEGKSNRLHTDTELQSNIQSYERWDLLAVSFVSKFIRSPTSSDAAR